MCSWTTLLAMPITRALTPCFECKNTPNLEIDTFVTTGEELTGFVSGVRKRLAVGKQFSSAGVMTPTSFARHYKGPHTSQYQSPSAFCGYQSIIHGSPYPHMNSENGFIDDRSLSPGAATHYFYPPPYGPVSGMYSNGVICVPMNSVFQV